MESIEQQDINQPVVEENPQLSVQKNALSPEVDAYAENLQTQIHQMLTKYGETDINAFLTKIKTEKIPQEDLLNMQHLMEQLHHISETGEILMSVVLQKKEHETLSAFFQKDILVPPPPPALLRVQERIKELGWTGLTPHYFPSMDMTTMRDLQTWKIQPELWIWASTQRGDLPTDTTHLRPGWCFWDGSDTPDTEDKEFMEHDYLRELLLTLRENHEIQAECPDVSPGSRFGISPDELEKVLFPTLLAKLGVTSTDATIRLPRIMEWNMMGNLYYPQWGTILAHEAMADSIKDVMPIRVITGGEENNKSYLGSFSSTLLKTSSYKMTSFRPMISFT